MGELARASRRIKLIVTIKEVVEPNIWPKNLTARMFFLTVTEFSKL
jgi:hypothetical protein